MRNETEWNNNMRNTKFTKKRRHRNNSKSIVMLILAIAAIAAIVLCIVLVKSNSIKTKKEFHLVGGTTAYLFGDDQYELSHEPFITRGNAYIPAEDILAKCGYSLTWDAGRTTLSITNGEIEASLYPDSNIVTYNGKNMIYNVATVMYEDILFMPLAMYKQFSDNNLYIEGNIASIWIPVRDTLEDTQIDDTYRMQGSAVPCNGVYVVENRVGMEMLSLNEDNCIKYAEVINSIAAALPEVQVYNIVVPSMTEFYGTEKIYTDQISGIRTIYQNLDERVMPINAVKELWAHANEHLYFGTDHHWTQRGAYYAYKAFLENRGEEVPALESFPTNNIEGFTGSWLNYAKNTSGESALRSNPETLERFLPVVEYTGGIYSDMYLQNTILSSAQAINEYSDSYLSFIHGDYPVTKFTTNVQNGKKVVLIKESYGNAFAPWLLNNFEEVYIVDPRHVNGFDGQNYNSFKLRTFYDEVCQFTDLIVIDYPGGASPNMRNAISALVS